MGEALSRVDVLGFQVERLSLDETAARLTASIREGKRVHHVSLNASKLVEARRDTHLAEVVRDADIVNADGQSIVWAARLLGDRLPGRVAGIDLMYRLLELAERENLGVFVLGARADILKQAIENLQVSYPKLRVVGCHDGYFDDAESDGICNEINAAEPTIVLIAMSSPRKELWAHAYRGRLNASLLIGVGGAIDIVAGATSRAPRWMQRAGLEWAFRLLQEPRRLGRRYLITNSRFIALVTAALVRRAAGHVSRRSAHSRVPERVAPRRPTA
jgi:N-acetylglucosaminyldiphosphoundecaprenol N-acetyl-beta-D-mannosaminyltransferase